MSLPASSLLAALPAIRMAGRGAARVAQSALDFAGHLVNSPGDEPRSPHPAGTDPISAGTDPASVGTDPSGLASKKFDGEAGIFDQLAASLQTFLRRAGFPEGQTIQLTSDGFSTIAVEGDSPWKERVEEWLNDHPSWVDAWQMAVQERLGAIPSNFARYPSPNNPTGILLKGDTRTAVAHSTIGTEGTSHRIQV